MAESTNTFRDFGVLPGKARPAEGVVRCFFSSGRIAGQYIGTALVGSLGIGLAVLFGWLLPWPLNLLGAAAAVAGFGALIFLATHNDYRWVELDGQTLRAKHLYTGRVIERSVDEIESLWTMVHQVRRLETVIIESLLGRIRGIEMLFEDGRTPLRIMRADPAMTNAEKFIEGVLYEMMQVGEVDTQIVDFDGRPLVRNVTWKGKTARPRPSNQGKVTMACLAGIAFTFGGILGMMGTQEQKQLEVMSQPAHEISVKELIQKGPGENRHVTLKDFRPGGFAFSSQSGSPPWSEVWVALFATPVRLEESREIQVVLSARNVSDEGQLKQLLSGGKVTGICSDKMRTGWGTKLGPELVGANEGRPLKAACAIEIPRTPPEAGSVRRSLYGSTICFGLVVLAAAAVFIRR